MKTFVTSGFDRYGDFPMPDQSSMNKQNAPLESVLIT
jgi:hypothetical protein